MKVVLAPRTGWCFVALVTLLLAVGSRLPSRSPEAVPHSPAPPDGDRSAGAPEAVARRPPSTAVALSADPLIPPLNVPGVQPDVPIAPGPGARFEPHGHQLCASGCAVSHHPTARLERAEFERLLTQCSRQPLDESNTALETLLYFGPQTRSWLRSAGVAQQLDGHQRAFLDGELQRTHVQISLQLVEQGGVRRAHLPPTRVPLDRRHVFTLQSADLPQLTASGTVKRVGLRHLWLRL